MPVTACQQEHGEIPAMIVDVLPGAIGQFLRLAPDVQPEFVVLAGQQDDLAEPVRVPDRSLGDLFEEVPACRDLAEERAEGNRLDNRGKGVREGSDAGARGMLEACEEVPLQFCD